MSSWPRKENAAFPLDSRLNILFGHVPGFSMNPMYLLELPLTFALTGVYLDEFKRAYILPCVLLYLWKELVPMSMCLHRYWSHKGFQCGRAMQFVLYVLGCMASQGPPLWWASKHRRHHAHCDTDEDPHSPVAHGPWYAWMGWVYLPNAEGPLGSGVDEEYVSDHLRFPELAFAENFHWVPVAASHALAWHLGGAGAAVFVSMWSGILCQVATLYFNVAFHTPQDEATTAAGTAMSGEEAATCQAQDLPHDPLSNLFGEAYHRWHHVHPRAYHRPGLDLPYWAAIKPLLLVGLLRGENITHAVGGGGAKKQQQPTGGGRAGRSVAGAGAGTGDKARPRSRSATPRRSARKRPAAGKS